MDTFKYNCAYCHEEFVPKRRYAQKYCSNSCRSKAYHRRQVEKGGVKKNSVKEEKNSLPQLMQANEVSIERKNTIEKMSPSGVGNAVLGNLIFELGKSMLTSDDSKPATKKDIAILLDKLGRYHLITNLPARPFSKFPYFDLYTNEVVYL